jgi:hypothetical protein
MNSPVEDSANLPDPDVIAAEIAEDLQSALDQFSQIASDLGRLAHPLRFSKGGDPNRHVHSSQTELSYRPSIAECPADFAERITPDIFTSSPAPVSIA